MVAAVSAKVSSRNDNEGSSCFQNVGTSGSHEVVLGFQAAYYWMGYAEDIRAHCRSCTVCESRRMPAKTMKAALQQYRMGAPMEWVTIDILGPFPKSN